MNQVRTVLDKVPVSIQAIVGALLLGIVYAVITGDRPVAGFPIVTVKREGWSKFLPKGFAFLTHGKEMLDKGLREHDGPFQVNTGSGYKIVVPNRFTDEIKNSTDVSFHEAFKQDLFVDYPGMDGNREGLKDSTFMQEVVRMKLTQSLGLVTDDLVDETDDSLRCILGEPTEWTKTAMKDNILDLVARLSSRVFLGLPICRDARWLQISKDYTIDSFVAARLLRMCPELVRPVVYWLIPTCTRLRKQVADARALIQPEVERRIKKANEALAAGRKPPKASDAIAWMVEVAQNGRETDFVAAQLSLTTAAIHTTSETTMKCLVRLCEMPELQDELRREMLQVLSTDGWSKTSLYKMKLLDSFLKEVQRSNVMSVISLNRMIKKPLTLSNGTTLPPGVRIMVSDNKGMDPETFPEPEKFDAARFLRLREQPGEENRHQFVTTHSSHMSFGHGNHACPGRFFASNEIKIALSFLLIKYEMRFPPLAPGEKPQVTEMMMETNTVSMPIQVEIRRRKEEIDLMNPLGLAK